MTERQRRFCDEYIISGNATQAAIEAGYSPKYANTNAAKLLQNTTIQDY
ncbi:MAG: terminase small subunit, partial [Clostridiales bacterium]|nr:terminase small subunit [Clostridiales bacterium]